MASANKGDESSPFMPQQETEKVEQVIEIASSKTCIVNFLIGCICIFIMLTSSEVRRQLCIKKKQA
jgi:hypothetical protein